MEPEKENSTQSSVENKPKKSNWVFWTCGGCLFLVITALIIIFVLKSFGGSATSKLFGDPDIPSESSKGTKGYSAMSKAELTNYFSTETTNYGSSKVTLSRWEKDIKIMMKGESTAEYLALIDKFIERFNENSNTIKMSKVTTGGNFTIEFGKNSSSGMPGGAAFSSGDDCSIDGAVVSVGPEADMIETLPDYIINHEMFHALGFSGHYRSEESCTLMSATHCGESFTENEDKLISMLYNSGIPGCLDEAGIRSFFESS